MLKRPRQGVTDTQERASIGEGFRGVANWRGRRRSCGEWGLYGWTYFQATNPRECGCGAALTASGGHCSLFVASSCIMDGCREAGGRLVMRPVLAPPHLMHLRMVGPKSASSFT